MKMIRYMIGLGLTGLLLANMPAFAEVAATHGDTPESYTLKNHPCNINWEGLHLSRRQARDIRNLDIQWQSIRDLIRPALIRDQECFRLMLINPDVTDNQVREMQKEIFIKQEQLRYEALENFLAKRRVLNGKQRIMLHNMLR
jgi:hypothetical protein